MEKTDLGIVKDRDERVDYCISDYFLFGPPNLFWKKGGANSMGSTLVQSKYEFFLHVGPVAAITSLLFCAS